MNVRIKCLFSLMLLFCGCAGMPHSRDVSPLEAARVREQVSVALGRREARIAGIKGLATVRVSAGIFSVKGDSVFALAHPAKVRIEALTDIGVPQSRVLIDGDSLTLLWPLKNLYYRGRASPENLEHFLRLPLDVRSLIDLLTGVIPPDGAWTVSRRKGDWFLRSPGSELVVKEEGGSWVPLRYVDKEKKYEVTYSEFLERDSVALPGRIQARFPDSRIDVRYQDVELNPKISKKLFELPIPKEARPLED